MAAKQVMIEYVKPLNHVVNLHYKNGTELIGVSLKAIPELQAGNLQELGSKLNYLLGMLDKSCYSVHLEEIEKNFANR